MLDISVVTERASIKRPKAHGKGAAAVLAWVERVAAFFAEQHGMPPITGRVLGWLLICDPPEQSAAEIALAIGASRASLTTNTQILIAAGLVRPMTRPRERTTYYRVDDDAWERILRRRIEGIASFRAITREGVAIAGGGARASRIRAADEVYAWFGELMAKNPGPRRALTRTTSSRRR